LAYIGSVLDIRKLLIKKYLFFIIPIVILVLSNLFYIDIFGARGGVNKSNCEDEQIIKRNLIHGIVTRKFVNKRGLEYFTYAQGKDTLISEFALLSEEFFHFLKVGDTISKEKGSLEFKVRRSRIDTSYQIDFDCNEGLL
jgi:hypothetical protein